MKFTNLSAALGAASLTIAVSLPAQALPWTYGIDSFNDGVTASIAGNNGAFEFYGMAIAVEGDKIYVALNANLDISGYADAGADDDHIGWGDLFLNFSGQDYGTALANANLFALHISGTDSDSGVQANGLYKVNSAKSVASANSGFNTLADHASNVNGQGGTASVSNIDGNYFDPASYRSPVAVSPGLNRRAPIPPADLKYHKNVMGSGTKIGDIAAIDLPSLSAKGLNFRSKGAVGSKTFGFSFSKADLNLPEEFKDNQLIASIFAECNNDGMGVVADLTATVPETPESVPEPASTLSFLVVVGGAIGLRRRRG